MELDTSTLMMLFFVLFLVMSIWKIWAFLPNKQLEDDDRTEESESLLTSIMLDIIHKHQGKITEKELHEKMAEHEDFDKKLFWRFNLNRLKQLLLSHYMEHDVQSIEALHKKIKEK